MNGKRWRDIPEQDTEHVDMDMAVITLAMASPTPNISKLVFVLSYTEPGVFPLLAVAAIPRR